MSDGDVDNLLDAIAAASGGARPQPPADPAPSRAASLIGRVAGENVRHAAPQRPSGALSDCEQLLGLDQPGWNRVLAQAPNDALVAVLAGASEAFRRRVVGSLDDGSRAWLSENLKLIGQVTPTLLERARNAVIDSANRLIAAGTIAAPGAAPVAKAAPAAPPAPAVAPAKPAPRPPAFDIGFGSATDPAGSAATVASSAKRPAADTPASEPGDTRELVAGLVAVAHGRDAAGLAQLANAVEHPFLAAGLQLAAAGVDGTQLTDALVALQADLMEAYARDLELMRAGILAIRFGEDAAEFRRRTGG